MEGRAAEEAEERYYISQMTPAERLEGFRRELEQVADKWLLPDPQRVALRRALGE